jgi:hypothetical protein
MTDVGTCPECGSRLKPVKPGLWAEEILVSGDPPSKQVLHAVQRSLFAYCPVHGKIVYKKSGNHSTQSEAKMKKLFPKNLRNAISEKLVVDERRRFADALNGHYLPTQHEINDWLRHVSASDPDTRDT